VRTRSFVLREELLAPDVVPWTISCDPYCASGILVLSAELSEIILEMSKTLVGGEFTWRVLKTAPSRCRVVSMKDVVATVNHNH
jgi:hypothetical protein